METSKKPTSVSIEISISPKNCKIWDQDGKPIKFAQGMQITINHKLGEIAKATLTVFREIQDKELKNTYVFEQVKEVWKDVPVLKFTAV